MLVTRREALGVLGAAGALSVLRLGGGDRARAATCAAAPAQIEGPYFVDERLARSDIRVDPHDGSIQPGVPLALRLTVVRTDGGCAPVAGVQVDVWHASAAGVYSDEAALGSTGAEFLRGYQVTDADGVVAFTTVYPGWYPGRTIHVHVKLRTFSGATTTYELTSQLYFDDAVSDQVMAETPYSARGARDTTNATDGVFDGALLFHLAADWSGGWVGTFTIGVTGLDAATTCADVASCRDAVAAALPDPTSASDAKHRRVAQRLARLDGRVNAALDGAATASGARQGRLYRRARALLRRLLAVASGADARGTLGVPLATVEAAVAPLVALLPAA